MLSVSIFSPKLSAACVTFTISTLLIPLLGMPDCFIIQKECLLSAIC